MTTEENRFSLNSSKIEVSSCRCVTTLLGAGNEEICVSNSSEVVAYTQRFIEGHWSYLAPGTDEHRYGTHTYRPNSLWNHAAEMMMVINVIQSGHPAFRGTSALAR